MFALISVTRDELDICESFHKTKEAAKQAMIDDIILMTNYTSEKEIKEASKTDECGFTDTEAWAETKQFGTGQWKIIDLAKAKA